VSGVDVLAVLDREMDGWADDSPPYKQLRAARAAVAELIEASRALQDAMDEKDTNKFDIGPAARFLAADVRHRAALARVTGGTP